MDRILGIGNALVDIITRIENDQLLDRLALPKGSMTMIDWDKASLILKETGGLPVHIAQGGSVANTIFGLAQLGMSAGYFGKVGDDEYGRVFRADLENHRINPHLLYGTSPTGRAITLVSKDGERTFGTYLGAAVEMHAGEILPSIFRNYRWLMVEGYLIFNHELLLSVVQTGRKCGMKIAIDMASYNLVENNLEFIWMLLDEFIDVVFANELEARALTGSSDPEKALKRIGKSCPLAIVKVGAEGSWIIKGDEVIKAHGQRANCIDTTGAGDQYAAGFLYGWLNGFSLKTCGDIGSMMGAHAVEIIGARIQEDRWEAIREYVRGIR
jgi:sugar/nucleoside kinase (ribokinase family)